MRRSPPGTKPKADLNTRAHNPAIWPLCQTPQLLTLLAYGHLRCTRESKRVGGYPRDTEGEWVIDCDLDDVSGNVVSVCSGSSACRGRASRRRDKIFHANLCSGEVKSGKVPAGYIVRNVGRISNATRGAESGAGRAATITGATPAPSADDCITSSLMGGVSQKMVRIHRQSTLKHTEYEGAQ